MKLLSISHSPNVWHLDELLLVILTLIVRMDVADFANHFRCNHHLYSMETVPVPDFDAIFKHIKKC